MAGGDTGVDIEGAEIRRTWRRVEFRVDDEGQGEVDLACYHQRLLETACRSSEVVVVEGIDLEGDAYGQGVREDLMPPRRP